jgi:uncharacterized protein (TIGR03382 family)
MNDALATLAFLLLVAGWTQRRRRARHVPLVLSAIALDLLLVIWLEVSRGVVERTMHDHFPVLRWAHIGSSTLAVVAYFPTLWLGFRMLRTPDDAALRRRHAAVATTALVLRAVGFVCMWGVEATK